MSEAICYLNGDYLPLDQACVPVLDRGFIFGDGVYEVIPVYAGNPFRLAHHLQRLTIFCSTKEGQLYSNPSKTITNGLTIPNLILMKNV